MLILNLSLFCRAIFLFLQTQLPRFPWNYLSDGIINLMVLCMQGPSVVWFHWQKISPLITTEDWRKKSVLCPYPDVTPTLKQRCDFIQPITALLISYIEITSLFNVKRTLLFVAQPLMLQRTLTGQTSNRKNVYSSIKSPFLTK